MIVTHTSPDWDAIGSVWLLQRYGGLGAQPVAFVNTGAPDVALLAEAVALVARPKLGGSHRTLPASSTGSSTGCSTTVIRSPSKPAGW